MQKFPTRPSSGRLSSLEVEGRLKFRRGRLPHASRMSREGGIVWRISVSESEFDIE
jgi:hypothetical protein